MGLTELPSHYENSMLAQSYVSGQGTPQYIQQLNKSDYFDLYFPLYRGSGSLMPQSYDRSGGNTALVIPKHPKLAHFLTEVTDSFNLTKEELAATCKVDSRATLYNWINGDASPRKASLMRIYDLVRVARAITHKGIKFKKEQLHLKALNGKSTFDLLQEDTINLNAIIFAASNVSFDDPNTYDLHDPFA